MILAYVMQEEKSNVLHKSSKRFFFHDKYVINKALISTRMYTDLERSKSDTILVLINDNILTC